MFGEAGPRGVQTDGMWLSASPKAKAMEHPKRRHEQTIMNDLTHDTESAHDQGEVRHPLRRTDVRMHELDGEALIFDPVSADTHRLNETALLIWRQCDGRHDVEHIASRLTETYDVSENEAMECVRRSLEEFDTCGLILVEDESTT